MYTGLYFRNQVRPVNLAFYQNKIAEIRNKLNTTHATLSHLLSFKTELVSTVKSISSSSTNINVNEHLSSLHNH